MDPRNVAHDKKVIQEKKHHGEDPAADAKADVVTPGKKPELKHHENAEKHHEDHVDPATARAQEAEEATAEVKASVEAHGERAAAQHPQAH